MRPSEKGLVDTHQVPEITNHRRSKINLYNVLLIIRKYRELLSFCCFINKLRAAG